MMTEILYWPIRESIQSFLDFTIGCLLGTIIKGITNNFIIAVKYHPSF